MRRLRLGDVYHRAGQRQQAIDVYVSTLSESGQDTWLETGNPRPDRAGLPRGRRPIRPEETIRIAGREVSQSRRSRRRRCRLLAELGDHDEAIKSYRALLELMPGDRDSREQFVDMLCRGGRFDAAVKELEPCRSRIPRTPSCRSGWPRPLHQAKQPAKAVEAARQFLKLSDGSEYAYLRAARLVESVAEKKEDARPLYHAMV